jgi:hypothetical protein
MEKKIVRTNPKPLMVLPELLRIDEKPRYSKLWIKLITRVLKKNFSSYTKIWSRRLGLLSQRDESSKTRHSRIQGECMIAFQIWIPHHKDNLSTPPPHQL